MRAGNTAWSVESLLLKHKDLSSSDPTTHITSQTPQQASTIPPMGRQRQDEPWSLGCSQLTEWVRSRFHKTLSQKIRVRATGETPSVSLWPPEALRHTGTQTYLCICILVHTHKHMDTHAVPVS